MEQFNAFIIKEFHHIFRDRRTMLILLVLPIILIFLLGFAISTDVRNVKLVYIAGNETETVRRIIARIDESSYFTVVGRVDCLERAEEMMLAAKADAVLRFSPDEAMQVVVDASNPNVATQQAMYIKNIIVSQLMEDMHSTVRSAVTPSVKMLYNPRMQSSFNFVPGILGLILILISAMMTSVSIVREKESGTMEILLSSPTYALTIIIAKMIPYFCVSCVNIATILLLSHYAMGVPLSGSIVLIVLFSMLYIFMALALGLLISTLTNSQTTALIMSAIMLMIPVMMLSGMMFPLSSMHKIFQIISCFVPARWFIDAMRKLMIEGLPFRYVAQDFAILSAMTVVFISVALKNFKTRLE